MTENDLKNVYDESTNDSNQTTEKFFFDLRKNYQFDNDQSKKKTNSSKLDNKEKKKKKKKIKNIIIIIFISLICLLIISSLTFIKIIKFNNKKLAKNETTDLAPIDTNFTINTKVNDLKRIYIRWKVG